MLAVLTLSTDTHCSFLILSSDDGDGSITRCPRSLGVDGSQKQQKHQSDMFTTVLQTCAWSGRMKERRVEFFDRLTCACVFGLIPRSLFQKADFTSPHLTGPPLLSRAQPRRRHPPVSATVREEPSPNVVLHDMETVSGP